MAIELLEQYRQALAELISQCAQEETDPERQPMVREAPVPLTLPVGKP
ncbi:hypothetical protein [Streptosporangium amethystogenes]|nr:hypothetical protein [Streptosporangium amethystogenes]